MKKCTIILFILALLVSVFSQSGFAREVKVKPVNNGGVVDGLSQTILADSTARKAALPEKTVYVLETAGIYPIVTQIINKGFFLHIKSDNTKGEKPRLVPAPRADGGFNAFFRISYNAVFENLNITAMIVQEPFTAIRHNIGIYDGAKFKAYGCVITHDTPGAAFNLWSDNCSIFLEDCIVHSTGHNKSLGGNGRMVSVRASVDTVSIVNCTSFDNTDRVFRNHGAGRIKVAIIDHNTFLNDAGFHGAIELGKCRKAMVTNNILYNLILFGSHKDRVRGGPADEQEQPEDDKMFVITLDTLYADNDITIANNNVFWDQQYKDLWVTYSAVTTAPGIITPTLLSVNKAPGKATFEETLKFVALPPSVYDYIAAGLANPSATIFPENFYFGEVSAINLSYGTSAVSYTAAGGGFPIGNLNYYPDKKTAWEAAGRPKINAPVGDRIVTVKPVNNGGVVDGLPQTILADSTARKAALPAKTVYVLEVGGIYPIVTQIVNKGFFLHIKSDNPKGEKPRLVPAPRADGGFNAFFRISYNAIFENLNITAMIVQEPFTAIRHNIGIYDGAKFKAYGCVIAHDTPGAAFNLWSDNCSIFLEDCIVHSTGHNKSLGGNGRMVSVRASVDTVSIVNCTSFDNTDRVFRDHGAGRIKVAIIDHNTFLNDAGYHGAIELGKCHKAIVTNNILYNLILFGSHKDRVRGGTADEQEQPEDDKMFVITLDTLYADNNITIANNNIFWDQQYKDLWATYSAVTTAPGLVTPTLLSVNKAPGKATFEETLTFVAPPPSVYEYIAAGLANPSATIFPENFYFGEVSAINLSYGTSAVSYTAAAGGFPIGNLNYYPDKKAEWVAAGKPLVTAVNEQIKNQPNEFGLAQNYPNPFNPSTQIDFVLSKNTQVTLAVYNVLGQRIKTLIDQPLKAGIHQAIWDGTNERGETVSNGVYFYRLVSESGVQMKKMTFMK